MKIILDLNVLMDYAQKREPHFAFSSIVISGVLKGHHIGHIPAHAVTTLYYLIVCLAQTAQCQYIITRNLSDFDSSPVAAITPEAFVRRFVVPQIDSSHDG